MADPDRVKFKPSPIFLGCGNEEVVLLGLCVGSWNYILNLLKTELDEDEVAILLVDGTGRRWVAFHHDSPMLAYMMPGIVRIHR
jgi:hypothetical protein